MLMKIPFTNVLKKDIKIIIVLIVSLCLNWLGWPCEALAQQSAAPTQTASGDILLSGKLACSLKRVVIMPFFGVMTVLSVQAGQKVAKGETLAQYRLQPEAVLKIRSRLFPAEIKELETNQVRLAAKMSELEKRRTGLQELAKNNLTSQQSLDHIDNEIRIAIKEKTSLADRLKNARQLHQDDLAVLKKQLGSPGGVKNIPAEGKLSAPLDGYVVWLHPDIRVGAELRPEEPVFFVGNLDTMIIKAQVHELEAMRLKLGDQAEVQVVSLPEQKFTGTVTRVSWSSLTSAVDQPSFFEVEFSVPNPEHILKDGLKVRVVVPKAARL
jgi:macrolide-specific efflux system membrane fusion protein